MNKTLEKLQQRREYISERVSNAKHPSREIHKICDELFLNERTIYRDIDIINKSKSSDNTNIVTTGI